MKCSAALLPLLLVATVSGCKREAPAASNARAAPVAVKPAQKGQATAGAVTHIVFVDQEKCCACTRKRINGSWQELTAVVGFPPVPEVERLHLDSQADRAAPYQKQRPILVPPAIYFFDGQGKLVEVLQGEVKREQVRRVLGRP